MKIDKLNGGEIRTKKDLELDCKLRSHARWQGFYDACNKTTIKMTPIIMIPSVLGALLILFGVYLYILYKLANDDFNGFIRFFIETVTVVASFFAGKFLFKK